MGSRLGGGDQWGSLSRSGGDGKAVKRQMGAKAEAWSRVGGMQQHPVLPVSVPAFAYFP